MTAVDWSRWRKCTVCHAEIGEACAELTGFDTYDEYAPLRRTIDRPHGGRKPRTGGA